MLMQNNRVASASLPRRVFADGIKNLFYKIASTARVKAGEKSNCISCGTCKLPLALNEFISNDMNWQNSRKHHDTSLEGAPHISATVYVDGDVIERLVLRDHLNLRLVLA